MNQNVSERPKLLWRKALIGSCLLLFLTILIIAIPFGAGIHQLCAESALIIQNRSGSDVRFEEVTIDGQVVWKGPSIIIRTFTNLQKPYLDTRGGSIMPHFRASKKIVELRLVTVNEIQERETVSCTLDNRSRPCIFEVHYFKGKLDCGKCEDYLD